MADALITLRKKVNPVYGHLFPDFFDRPEVVETRATCDTCAMCDHGQTSPVAMDYFRPDVKCCTYHPNLPNYLVGAILADESEDLAEGRRRIREKIASRIGVTPQFIAPPRKYTLHYLAGRGRGFFGRSLSMMCPYFDGENGGRCTVWKYREAVCSTYFCKYTAGKPAYEFWDTLKGYLGHVERSLSFFAASVVDRTTTEPKIEPGKLTREDLDDVGPNAADYASYWGKGAWVGREEEFYIACYRRVMELPKADFDRVVDDAPDGRGMLARMEVKYDQIMDPTLPTHLVRTKNLTRRNTDESVVVTTYNPFDAFSVDKDLFDTLGMFRPNETLEENLARLDEKHDIQLAPDLVRYLFVHGVLSAPEPVDKKKLEAEAAAAAAEAAAQAASAGAQLVAEHDRAQNPGAARAPKQPIPTFIKRKKKKR